MMDDLEKLNGALSRLTSHIARSPFASLSPIDRDASVRFMQGLGAGYLQALKTRNISVSPQGRLVL